MGSDAKSGGPLAGKRALVTGAARGIGQAVAVELAALGTDLLLTARDVGTLADTQSRLPSDTTVTCQSLDLSDRDDITAFLSNLNDPVDILVNNAGLAPSAPLEKTKLNAWDEVYQVNVTAPFMLQQGLVPAMKDRGWGRVVNVASTAGLIGYPFTAAYVSSKHGMVGLTRASAVELGAHGITVNAICPNHVTTGLGAQQNEYVSKLLGFDTVEDYLANMSAKNPMGRPGLPSDTAAACLWLASDEAFYVTGEALNVSGGEEMH